MGCRGSIWQADGAWSDELSFLWWMCSFSYGHAFPTGFYMATSFNEASGDVMGLLFFCPSFFLSSFLYCLIVRGEVLDISIAQRGPPRPAWTAAGRCPYGRYRVAQVANGHRRHLGPATSRPLRADARGRHRVAEVANRRRRHLDRRWQVATKGSRRAGDG
jgi:hypothetical protein